MPVNANIEWLQKAGAQTQSVIDDAVQAMLDELNSEQVDAYARRYRKVCAIFGARPDDDLPWNHKAGYVVGAAQLLKPIEIGRVKTPHGYGERPRYAINRKTRRHLASVLRRAA